MSDIRYNQWLHNSGTGGVSQDAGGNVGIGTTNPLIPVGAGNTAILNVGVVSATTYYGNANNLSFTNLTAVDGTFSGDVSIGGTLTYQDVTNIDSVGLVTARDGVNVSGGDFKVGTGATIYSDGNASVGILTARAGINLTGGSGTFNGDLTFTGASHNGYWEKSNSRFKLSDNGKVVFGDQADLSIYHSGSHSFIKDSGTGALILNSNEVVIKNAADNEDIAKFIQDGACELFHNGTKKIETDADGIRIGTGGGDNTIVDLHNASYDNGLIQYYNGSISLKTGSSNGDRTFQVHTAGSERIRIASSGDMGLGTNSPNSYSNQRVFTINGTSHGRLDLEVGGTLKGSVWADSGGLGLDAGGNEIEFYAGSAERLRINSSGALGLGGATYGSSGQVLTSAGSGGVPTWTTISAGIDSDSDSNTVGGSNAGNAGTWSGATSNTCFGKDAGTDITDSDGGTFFGHQAGANVTSGNNNVAVGYVSILENTTGTENTAIGNYSMQRSTGSNNTAVGSFALRGVSGSSGGGGNTAVGAYALDAYTSSSNNTAVGWRAMSAKTSGDGNTAIGKDALRLNQTGGENTIVGEAAADSNTSNRNTVIGKNALYSNTGGYDNVVIGRYAMMLSNSGNSVGTQGCTVIGTNAMYTGGGDGNIAIGAAAAYNYTSAHNNTVIGGAAFDANTTGNYTVAIGNNCLGAYNNSSAELVAIGSQCAVSLTSGGESVYIGRECASNITGGAYNVIIGKGAMAGSTANNANSNVVIGRNAGRLITGSGNVILGREAAYDLTGSQNIIMGYEAAYNMTSGGHNICLGYRVAHTNALTSGHNVMIGNECCKDVHASSGSIVAIGANALDAYDGYSSTHGGWTVAIGAGAMGANRNTRHSVCVGNTAGDQWNPTAGNVHEGGCVFVGGNAGQGGPTTATSCVAVGRNAYSGGTNKTGANNIAIGTRSLEQAVAGAQNVVMGTFAGYRITSGDNNVMIGYLSGYGYDTTNATQSGSQNCFIGGHAHSSANNTTYENVLGYGGTGKGSNTSFIKGSSGAYNEKNVSSWDTTSDIRIKKNVVDNNVGLDAIEKIRVRNFEYRTKEEITDFDNPEAVVCNRTGTQLGVIAQEIQEILPDVVEQQSTGAYTVNPDNLTWYLVNAVKELSAEVKSLKAQLNS